MNSCMFIQAYKSFNNDEIEASLGCIGLWLIYMYVYTVDCIPI